MEKRCGASSRITSGLWSLFVIVPGNIMLVQQNHLVFSLRHLLPSAARQFSANVCLCGGNHMCDNKCPYKQQLDITQSRVPRYTLRIGGDPSFFII